MNTLRTGSVRMIIDKPMMGPGFESSASRWKSFIGATILSVTSIALSPSLGAVEGGGSNWVMGASGFNAGVVPKPGFHLNNLTTLTDFSTNQDITLGNQVVTNLDVDVGVHFFLPTFAGEIERWNTRYHLLLSFPLIFLDGTFRVQNGPNESERKDFQRGDFGFEPAIGWRADDLFGAEGVNLDYKTGMLVVTPTGHYEQQETLNAGKYRWTFQPYVAYTLFDEGTGLEASQRIMYAFNTKNGRTNYRSGQEFHFDWAVGKRFDSGFTVGAFGFWYRQTTADGGRGAQQTGDLKGKAWGIGPVVQYSREIAGIPTTAAFRWQRVPQHRNRVDDDSFMFTIAFSF